jgi:hypothetical protein
MHNLGYQIPKTKQQRNQILAGLADPPLKKLKKINGSLETFCDYEKEI